VPYVNTPYSSLDVVFNNANVWANIQDLDPAVCPSHDFSLPRLLFTFEKPNRRRLCHSTAITPRRDDAPSTTHRVVEEEG